MPYVYAPITSVAKAAPVSIVAADHGLPDGWPVAVVSVQGMWQINAKQSPPGPCDYKPCTVVDDDTIQINSVNSLDFDTATPATGVVQFLTPVDLAGFTAELQIRSSAAAEDPILTLSTTTGEIVIDNVAKTIAVEIPAAVTASLSFANAVFQLELTSSTGVVTRLDEGVVTLSKEVVRA